MIEKTAILISDFDGTLFDSNFRIFLAPFYNLKISKILKKHNIPFILTTGRPAWSEKHNWLFTLCGITKPHILITGCGTQIFQQNNGIWKLNSEWNAIMEKNNFDKLIIQASISSLVSRHKLEFAPNPENPYVIRIKATHISTQKLQEIMTELQSLIPPNTKTIFTESRKKTNSVDIFSGYIFIIPKDAGKDLSAQFILHQFSTKRNYTCLVCGDALIDIPLLELNLNQNIEFKRLAVDLTPLANQHLQQNQHVTIAKSGPETILKTLQEIYEPKYFSKAQNNPIRNGVKIFEDILNSFFDKKLSANDLSLLGVDYSTKGLEKIQSKNMLTKLYGFWLCLKGFFMDMFDGIRARKQEIKDPNGQLVDVFADRAKEFFHLYFRAESRLEKNKIEGEQTFVASLSCILPSMSRAFAEACGKTVPEYDPNGGSMLSRTLTLLQSLFLNMIGFDKSSFKLDIAMQQSNIRTFEARMTIAQHSLDQLEHSIDDALQKEKNSLEYKAAVRLIWLLMIFQQELKIIKNSHKDIEINFDNKNISQNIKILSNINCEQWKTHVNLPIFFLQSFKIS